MRRLMVVCVEDGLIMDVVCQDNAEGTITKFLKKWIQSARRRGQSVAIYENVPNDDFPTLPLTVRWEGTNRWV